MTVDKKVLGARAMLDEILLAAPKTKLPDFTYADLLNKGAAFAVCSSEGIEYLPCETVMKDRAVEDNVVTTQKELVNPETKV
jgi:hypothetical protein